MAAAPDESVALLMDGVLKDAGIPSLIQRAAGFDAPDFLSAGPRDAGASFVGGRSQADPRRHHRAWVLRAVALCRRSGFTSP